MGHERLSPRFDESNSDLATVQPNIPPSVVDTVSIDDYDIEVVPDVDTLDPVRAYFNQLNRYPARGLTYSQQQAIFHLPLSNHSSELFHLEEFSDLRKPNNQLTKDQTRLKNAIHDSSTHREVIYYSNLPLAVSIAKRYVRPGVELIDLIQEANMGMLQAIDMFNPDYPTDPQDPNGKKVEFATYAIHRINRTLQRYIADYSRTMRIPAYRHTALNTVRKISASYEIQYGEKPNESTLFEFLRDQTTMNDGQIQDTISLFNDGRAQQPASLDEAISADTTATRGDLIEDPQARFEEHVLDIVTAEELREKFDEVLGELTEREREFIITRFGLNDGIHRTTADASKIFGFTSSNGNQIERRALSKLRRKRKSIFGPDIT